MVTIVVFIIAPPFARAADIPAGGMSSMNAVVFAAPSNSVVFVFPDSTGGSPRCTSLYDAAYGDWIAGGILLGKTSNLQTETLDDNADYVNTIGTNCAPKTTNTVYVLMGGPNVNNLVYNNELASSRITPVYFASDDANVYFKKTSDNSNIVTFAKSSLGGATDYFVIEIVADASGNSFFIFYGFTSKGSNAAAELVLSWIQGGILGSQTDSYYVYRWQDTNGDGIVNLPPTDTYTLITSG